MFPERQEEEMRWSDERWVAFLKDQGPRWARLSFGARCTFPLLLRIIDRAGRRDLAGCGTEGVAHMLRARAQDFEFVSEAVEELAAAGFIASNEDDFCIIDFRDGRKIDLGTRYVRLYTRDTPSWIRLSVVARGLFCLILTKVDLAGILGLDVDGMAGLSHYFDGDHDIVQPALAELIADGCIEVNHKSRQLVVANYVDAQQAKQSDAARQQATRERARDEARAATASWEAELQSVTAQPLESQAVTPSLTDPTEPNKPTGKVVEIPDTSRASLGVSKPTHDGVSGDLDPAVADVLSVLRSTSDGVLRSIATKDLAHKIASHSQAGAFTGRAALEDVIASVRAAADKEHTAIAAGEFPRGKGPLSVLVMGFVRNTKRGDAQRAAAKVEDDSGAVIAVFERMWCKKFNAEVRCPDARDEWAAGVIATTLKKHAVAIKAPRWGEILELAVKGYLELGDKGVELKDYPLWEMPNRLATVLREIRPRPKAPVQREPAVRVDPRENMVNGRQAYADFQARLRTQQESERIMLKCASPIPKRPNFLGDLPPATPPSLHPPVRNPDPPVKASLVPANGIPAGARDPGPEPAEEDVPGLEIAPPGQSRPCEPAATAPTTSCFVDSPDTISPELAADLRAGTVPPELLEDRETARLAGEALARRRLRDAPRSLVATSPDPHARDGPAPDTPEGFFAALGGIGRGGVR